MQSDVVGGLQNQGRGRMRGVDYSARQTYEAVASSRFSVRRAFLKTMPITFVVVLMVVRIEGIWHMRTYEFDVILKTISEVTDDHADALFAAGCEDGTPACCNGLAWIHFDREAVSLEEAIRSAVSQVQSAGLPVSKVELDAAVALAVGV